MACAKQEKPASLRAKFGVQSDSGVENAIHSSDSSVSMFDSYFSVLTALTLN